MTFLSKFCFVNTGLFATLGVVILLKQMPGLGMVFESELNSNLLALEFVYVFVNIIIVLVSAYLSDWRGFLRSVFNICVINLLVVFTTLLYICLNYVVAQETIFLTIPALGFSFSKNNWTFLELLMILLEYIVGTEKLILPLGEIIELVNKNSSPESLILAYDRTVELELLSREMAKLSSRSNWLVSFLNNNKFTIFYCIYLCFITVALVNLAASAYATAQSLERLDKFQTEVEMTNLSLYHVIRKEQNMEEKVAFVVKKMRTIDEVLVSFSESIRDLYDILGIEVERKR